MGVPGERIMLVRGDLSLDQGVSVGSGTLIGPTLVLTAAHVVFDDDGSPLTSLRVGPPEETLVAARVVWPKTYREQSSSRDRDAALIEITDTNWVPPAMGLVRWGRLTGRAAGVDCEATGFPRVLRDPNGTRDADQVKGTINPGSRRVAGRYDLHVTSSVPTLPTSQRTPSVWSGMSGAGVFSNGILIGIIVIDEPDYPANRLSAFPVHSLALDADFDNIFQRITGTKKRIEVCSVELDPILSSTWPRRARRRSPASLLRADAEVVAFRSRDTDVLLTDWCKRTDELDFRLLVGPGGQGKTRLARELIHLQAAEGWVAGFLAPDPPENPHDINGIIDSAVPLLLIIDYAETRSRQLKRLLDLLDGASEVGKVRILLLARSAGQWWNNLRLRYNHPLENAQVRTLAALDSDLNLRREAFDRAIDSFAYSLADFGDDVDWQEFANLVDYPDDLDADRYGSPLTLQMTALIHLLGRNDSRDLGQDATGISPSSLEDQILAHEQKYWEDTATDHGIELHEITLSAVVAATAFLGASGAEDALRTLARLPGIRDQPEDRRVAVNSWLHDLYPATADQHWGPLQPDRIGERHIMLQFANNPELLGLLLAGASDEQTFRALTLLHRALPQRPDVARQLRSILERDRERLEPIAITVAKLANDRSLSILQGVGEIYSMVNIDDRRVIWDQWLGPKGVMG
jgi:hypothetical protein